MTFDFSKAITRESNSVVNKAVDSALKSVNSSVNLGIGNSLKSGTEQILNDIGAPPAVRQAIRSINADVINASVQSASDIFQGILDGVFTSDTLAEFSSMDVISAALKRKNINAINMNNLNVLAGAARNVNQQPPNIETDVDSSPYATDFANNFTPKVGFLFLVEFIFNHPFSEEPIFKDSSFHTVIHKFDRPKVDIDHEEVNMYNFTTHVPKMVKYNPVSFTAHDDSKNSTMSVLVSYLRTISPVFNIDSNYGSGAYERIGGLSYDTSAEAVVNSSNFGSIQQYRTSGLTESTGGFDSITSIFKEIKIYHLYDFGQLVDVYSFLNPKITSIQMDKFDMSENVVNSITFDMVYDGFFIDVGVNPTDSSIINFDELNRYAQFNPVNRDVQRGIDTRTQQIKARSDAIRAQGLNQAEIDRLNNKLNDETFYAGITDYEREQQILDDLYAKGSQNPNTFSSLSVDSIVKGVKTTYNDVVGGIGRLFK